MTGSSSILEVVEQEFPWAGMDPFIFTVHHVDHYPAGNGDQGPVDSLAGRNLGMDFSYRNGWSMYHGDTVPGFPQHPHRGFETVTVVRRGYVDHSDSLGATARYGEGDVQWLTTGSGIMHSEMFPLIEENRDNPLELFQIWLNLPPRSKMVPAYFGMLWAEDIPTVVFGDGGPKVSVDVVAGELEGRTPPNAPPDSWASNPAADMAIWVIDLDPGARWELPPAPPGVNRMLHMSAGSTAGVGGTTIQRGQGAKLRPEATVAIEAPDTAATFLLLQGRPIGAPVIQMGPFVMNTPEEIQTALNDYRRTGFGGWPWSTPDPVHDRSDGRFALHADGTVEHRDRRVRPAGV